MAVPTPKSVPTFKAVADRYLASGLKGGGARLRSRAELERKLRTDLKAWHDRTVAPNNIIIGVSGDFDSVAMESKLRAAFEPLPRGEKFESAKITFTDPKPGVNFVEKSDVLALPRRLPM